MEQLCSSLGQTFGAAPAATQPLQVLVVEDDRASRLVMRHILTKAGGIQVSEAIDGIQAWELLITGTRPDLCFLDINMPRMDGLELLRNLRADPELADIKVCFCSAIRDRNLVGQACAIKPDFYVLKPYTPQTIMQVVDKVRQPFSAARGLDGMANACARLNLTPEAYDESLLHFIGQIEDLKAEVTARFMRQDLESAFRLLQGAKTEAQRLGATKLHDTLDELARLFKRGGGFASQQTNISPTEFLSLFAEELMKGMQRIQDDLRTLKAAEQKLSAQLEAKKEAEKKATPAEVELAALATEINTLLSGGKLISFEKSGRSKPLEISIRPPVVGQSSEEQYGLVTRKTSFKLAIPDRQTSEAVEELRKVTDVTRVLSIGVDANSRWIPDKALPLLERELAHRNQRGAELVRKVVGDDLEDYLARQAQVVRDHLVRIIQESGKASPPPERQIEQILDSMRERLSPVLEGGLSPKLSVSGVEGQLRVDPAVEGSWEIALGVLEWAALTFRSEGSDGLATFNRELYRGALDILKDHLAAKPDAAQAALEAKEVRRIMSSEQPRAEKCRLLRALIRGAMKQSITNPE